MEHQFGHNCTHFLPSLGKCRVLIDLYSKREDLVAKQWLDADTLVVYSGLSVGALLEQVRAGRIEPKRLKNGRLQFGMLTSWAWDECAGADMGGTCLHFEPHDGEKIRCLEDLTRPGTEHPASKTMPLPSDLRRFEESVNELLDQPDALQLSAEDIGGVPAP